MSTNYWRREEITGDSQENTQSAAEHAIVRGRKGGRGRERERETKVRL
jgi:flavin-binding protein dodecin